MLNRKLFFVFLINIFILLGVSQAAFAGDTAIDTVTASCSGDDVRVELTGRSTLNADITWSGTTSDTDVIIGIDPFYIIDGPGTFEVTVEDNYPGSGGIFNLGPITCGTPPEPEVTPEPGEGSITVTRIPTEEFIELCADGRTNTNLCDPLAIYPVESDDGVGMLIYRSSRTDEGLIEFALYIPAEDMARLPDEIEEACTIAASEDGSVVVYLLPTGEIQVNTGPDEENKFFVFRYEIFPSIPEVETYFGDGSLPILPSCSTETEVGQMIFGEVF